MGRLTLKQMILNKCEEERGLAVELAAIGGYSSGSALLKILKDEKKEFAKFYGLIKIVRHLFPDQEKEVMSQYALALDPNKQIARIMLEYLNTSGQHDVKRNLIEMMVNSKNNLSKEIASIYEIDDLYLTKLIDFNEAINRYTNLINKSEDSKVITEILKSYCFLDEQEYSMIKRSLDVVENEIGKLKDEYLNEILLCRYSLLLVGYYVRQGKKMKVRDICWNMINQVEDPYFKSWAFLHLGNSYIIESYDFSYRYLRQGMALLEGKENTASYNLKRSVNFVSNLWNKDTCQLSLKSNHPSDVHEVAFYYVSKGQTTMATKTLDTLNFEELSVNQKAFHMYYRGLLSNKLEDYSKSIVFFKQSGDYFFRQLPLIKIEEMQIPSCLIEALAQ
jgi:hypothetical protein